MRLQTVLGLSLATAAVCAASAADWPQWQGPNRDNISTEKGLLQAWPKEGPPLAWKATELGAGYSGVSVARGKIFTIGDCGDSAFVEALAFDTGKKLWEAKLGQAGGGGGYPGPRATPAVDGDFVYALGQYGDLACLRVADGKEVWRKSLKADFGGRMMSGWGYAESPLVDGKLLLCTPGGAQGTVCALDKATGAVRWRSTDFTDAASYASLVAVDFGGVHQAIVLTDAHVAGIAIDSGKLLWSAPRVGKTAVVPTPVFKDGRVFVTSGYGIGCNLFKVEGGGAQFTANEVYTNKDMINHHGGVVLVDKHLYGFSDGGKGWSCLDFATGAVASQWQGGIGKGTLTRADGRFYLRAEGGPGTLVLMDATPDGWKEAGRFDPPDRSTKNSWPHLVISNGRLFVRDQDVLLCYNIQAR